MNNLIDFLKCKVWFLHDYNKWKTVKGTATYVHHVLRDAWSVETSWQERICKDCGKIQRKDY